ncbi:MAG: DUF4364 family protein [Angelakisella sp.]
MEYKAFTEGVRPGSVTTSHEVIILICYMVSKSPQPVSLEQLGGALLQEELVNYFEFTNASEYLVKSGHLVAGEDGLYTVSPLGTTTAKTFESDLPTAVRERAMCALNNILKLLRRQEENRVEIAKTSDGYQLTMTITDIGTDLMSLQMFMPNKEECEVIRKRFLNDPLTIYKGVFALLTGDMKTVGSLLPSGEDLFDE